MRQKVFFLLAGKALGMVLLSGSTALASTVLTATPSNQEFYIDGRRVTLTAYQIGGNNYLKLRDIGQAVGFNVYWDGTVQIESDKPYTGIAPVTQALTPTQQTQSVLTQERVQAAIKALRNTYPPNTVYGDFEDAGNAIGLEHWNQYWSNIWFMVAQAMSWYYEHGIILDLNSNKEGAIEQIAEEFVAAMKLYHKT